jgi:hypothetical protein
MKNCDNRSVFEENLTLSREKLKKEIEKENFKNHFLFPF